MHAGFPSKDVELAAAFLYKFDQHRIARTTVKSVLGSLAKSCEQEARPAEQQQQQQAQVGVALSVHQQQDPADPLQQQVAVQVIISAVDELQGLVPGKAHELEQDIVECQDVHVSQQQQQALSPVEMDQQSLSAVPAQDASQQQAVDSGLHLSKYMLRNRSTLKRQGANVKRQPACPAPAPGGMDNATSQQLFVQVANLYSLLSSMDQRLHGMQGQITQLSQPRRPDQREYRLSDFIQPLHNPSNPFMTLAYGRAEVRPVLEPLRDAVCRQCVGGSEDEFLQLSQADYYTIEKYAPTALHFNLLVCPIPADGYCHIDATRVLLAGAGFISTFYPSNSDEGRGQREELYVKFRATFQQLLLPKLIDAWMTVQSQDQDITARIELLADQLQAALNSIPCVDEEGNPRPVSHDLAGEMVHMLVNHFQECRSEANG